MKRRQIFSTAIGGAAALALPAAATTKPSTDDKLKELLARLKEAAVYYEDYVSGVEFKAYFNGFLAGQGLNDWRVETTNTGKAGYIVDIVIRFPEDSTNHIYIPVRFSKDYWQRQNRLTEDGRVRG